MSRGTLVYIWIEYWCLFRHLWSLGFRRRWGEGPKTLGTSICFPSEKDHDAVTNPNGTKMVKVTKQWSIH